MIQLSTPKTADPPHWLNIVFVLGMHVLAVAAVLYAAFVHFSWWTLGLGMVWFLLCGLAITGGYHRLFSHPTYRASWPVRLFLLIFGAASVQNSALKWAADHRAHHAFTDTDRDPYNIQKGFWWAHIGWVLARGNDPDLTVVRDLRRDRLLRWQDENYVLLAIIAGVGLPVALGLIWGDALGAFLVAGALRLVVQWHATFAVNSFAHTFGSRPYDTRNSARDSLWVALISFGEGYHNFHHRFPMDYRNGTRWFHFDPTKWTLWLLSKCGLVRDLHRVRASRLARSTSASWPERSTPRGTGARVAGGGDDEVRDAPTSPG